VQALSAYQGHKAIFNAEYSLATSSFCPADVAAGINGAKFDLSLTGSGALRLTTGCSPEGRLDARSSTGRRRSSPLSGHLRCERRPRADPDALGRLWIGHAGLEEGSE